MNQVFDNLKYLHVVRGLAALIVVIFHAKFVLWVGGVVYKKDHGLHTAWDYFLFGIDMLSSCGEQCVIIFFILSAFVIRHSFDKYKDDLPMFYRLRLFRIYVPFLFSVLFSIGILLLCFHYINPSINAPDLRQYNARLHDAYTQLSFSQIMQTIFLTEQREYAGANYAYWSLAHELVFYILFPLYYRLKRNLKMILIAALLMLFFLTEWRIFYFQVYFIGGLLMYEVFRDHSQQPAIPNKWLNYLAIAILYVFMNILVKFAPWSADILTVVFCFFLFDLFFYHIKQSPPILMRLGDISYTLYLNHLPLLLLYYSILTLYAGKLVFYSRLPYYTGVLFALLFSVPLYYFIEKPSIGFLKKLRR